MSVRKSLSIEINLLLLFLKDVIGIVVSIYKSKLVTTVFIQSW